MNLPEKLTPLHHALAIVALGVNLWNLFSFDINATEPPSTPMFVAGAIGTGYLIMFYIWPMLHSGGNRNPEIRKKTLQQVQELGQRSAGIRCRGRVGFLTSNNDYRLEVEIYPRGLTVKMPFLPITAILSEEIERISEKRSLVLRKPYYEIMHHSRQIATPIRLRCGHDRAFCAALEALKPHVVRRKV